MLRISRFLFDVINGGIIMVIIHVIYDYISRPIIIYKVLEMDCLYDLIILISFPITSPYVINNLYFFKANDASQTILM